MEKDFKNIVMASIVFLLVASCFQPTSFAQGSKGHIVAVWDEISGDEITTHVTIRDDKAGVNEYRIYIYSAIGEELEHQPCGWGNWKELDGEECVIDISSEWDLWDVKSLKGMYQVVLKEKDAGFQDEKWIGKSLTPITFNADCVSGGDVPNPQSYYWDFGDGSQTSISDKWDKVYHTYWKAKDYDINLKILGDNGWREFSEKITIKNDYGDSGVQSEEDELKKLAKKYSPVLYVDEEADHNCPGPINQILDNSVLKQKSWSTDPTIDDDPSIGDLMAYSGDQYYLDENNHDDQGDDPTTYVHFRKENNRYFIQYYFFYYFNDGLNNHEGDLEMIQISFEKQGSEYIPCMATYSQHTWIANFNWGEKRDWRNVEKYIDGDKLTNHSIVYVSSNHVWPHEANSHANYFYKGDGPDTDYTDDCSYAFKFSPDDIIFLPNLEDSLSDPEWNNFGWIQFAGRWGECGVDVFDGPPGPAFGTFKNNLMTGPKINRWVYPYEFEEGRNYDGNHEPKFPLYYTKVIADQKSTEEGVPVKITAKLFYQEDNNLRPFSGKDLFLYIDGYYHGYEITDEHGQASFSYTPVICGEHKIDIVFKGSEESSSHYTWSDCTTKLSVYSPSLIIQSPTTSNPAKVGDPANPNEFEAIVTTGSQSYPEDAFEITIGEKTALYNVYLIDDDNNYYFTITPPTQENEGTYDLEVSIPSVSTDIEQDAVIFSTGGNVDVMTVIDRSGSMSGGKIAAAKTASSLFVDLMNVHDMIGVASFGSSGYLNFPLTEIISETIKQQAKNAINALYASGMTAMGSGLQQGYNQLVNYGDPAHPWSMILLSDGYHNSGIHPYTVLPSIQNENIRVFTIGLGTSVDQNLLQYIADNTGGEYYYSPGTGELTTIYQSIAGVVKAESTVKTGEGTVNVGETVTKTVHIDSSIDTATFTLNWESGTCDLELKRPDDTVVIPSDSDVLSHAVEANYETFTITDPADGTWAMEITRTHASSLKYTVTVTASTDVTFHLFTDKDDYYQEEPIHLISTLSNSGNPITGADVDITIEKPDGSFDYITLFDDGYHDDGAASDGVYANYYTNTDLGGSYDINAHASGTIGTEEFTREATKTVYVSGIPSEGLSVIPSSWDTEAVYTGEHIVGGFTIDSLSLSDETVTLTATDFINDTDIISAENILFAPETFDVPAGGSTTFYTIIFAPEDAKSGNYTGNIILTSTVNSITIPVKLWVVESIQPSTIDINPDTLNLNSGGKWITCYIELPDGYDVADIDISTVLLNDVVSAEDHPTNIGDYDNDGIPDLMVKFDRQAIQDILEVGDNVEITVRGELLVDGTLFEGTDYIRVI